jgi:hypothetical protein
MDGDEFEALLTRAGTTTAVRQATLDELVQRTRASRRRSRSRKPVVIGVAVLGAALLAAAATSSAWTKIPPFQSLPADQYRTQTAIPVDYTTTSGQAVRCQAFLEYLHLSVAEADQAQAYVRQHDWTGFGQRLYDAGAPAHERAEHAQSRVLDALDPALTAVEHEAVPSAAPKGSATDGASISGWSIVCRAAK